MISSEKDLKAISDPMRLYIMRRLILQPMTITQLGNETNRKPSLIRQHILVLQKANLVELIETRKVHNYTEKYYRATARAYFVNSAIFPVLSKNQPLELVLGSDDLALGLLGKTLEKKLGHPFFHIIQMGSLDGLILMRNGYSRIAGTHLLDFNTGEYNVSTIKMLFSNAYPVLITLSHRQQGLIVQKGNPAHIHSISDIVEKNVRFINRNEGAGTRRWFDHQLEQLHLSTHQIQGYDHAVVSHREVAEAVMNGRADTGIGIYAVAKKAGVDFIPLFEEKFQLAILPELFDSPRGKIIQDAINDRDFQQSVSNLGGYRTDETGTIVRLAV